MALVIQSAEFQHEKSIQVNGKQPSEWKAVKITGHRSVKGRDQLSVNEPRPVIFSNGDEGAEFYRSDIQRTVCSQFWNRAVTNS